MPKKTFTPEQIVGKLLHPHDGRSLGLLTMIDEFTRECLVLRVARRLNSFHVIETLG